MSRSDRGDRGRCPSAHTGADEGAMYRAVPFLAGVFRRLRAATYFAHGGKVGKTPPGTAPDEHFVLIVAFPRTPFTGVIPLAWQRISGAQNLSECLNSSRATGPWVCKNFGWCGPVGAPGFTEPTLPVQIPAGGPRASPTQSPKSFLGTVGAAISRPFPGGQCPAPTHILRRFRLFRRGGCPHPPARNVPICL